MWVFNRTKGQLISPSGEVFTAYSGHGVGVNNPTLQNVKDVGPIPSGIWYFQAPIDTVDHGPYALPLIPDAKTETFGRSGFMFHGDEVKHPCQHLASLGCLIGCKMARQQVWEGSEDHTLNVI